MIVIIDIYLNIIMFTTRMFEVTCDQHLFLIKGGNCEWRLVVLCSVQRDSER